MEGKSRRIWNDPLVKRVIILTASALAVFGLLALVWSVWLSVLCFLVFIGAMLFHIGAVTRGTDEAPQVPEGKEGRERRRRVPFPWRR